MRIPVIVIPSNGKGYRVGEATKLPGQKTVFYDFDIDRFANYYLYVLSDGSDTVCALQLYEEQMGELSTDTLFEHLDR